MERDRVQESGVSRDGGGRSGQRGGGASRQPQPVRDRHVRPSQRHRVRVFQGEQGGLLGQLRTGNQRVFSI